MKKMIRAMAALLLTVMVLTWGGMPARAEVATIGVSFSGLTEREDGSFAVTPLEGSFRLLQNGETVAVLQAGKDTATVEDTGRLYLEPVMETMPLGWDLSTAAAEIRPEGGATVFVPVVVYASDAAPEAAVIPTAEPAAQQPEEEARPGDAEQAEAEEIPDGQESRDAAETAVPQTVSGGETHGEPIALTLPTAVPAPMPTPEPMIPEGSGSASLRVLAFNDRNTNGEQGTYEDGLAGVKLYLISTATGEPAAVAETDSEGLALLSGVPEGTYRLKAWLPESWAFSEKGKETGLQFSCIGTSVEASAESGEIQLKAGETAERGIGAARMIHVSGFCWLDEDGDGVYKKGEPLLAGVHITLEGQKNGLVYDVYSGEDGAWYADRVRPGFYTITAYAPQGMTFTRYSRTGGNNRSIFTAEGSVKASKTLDTNDKMPRDNQNVGFTAASEISGICFLDANYNGVYDEGEQPLSGVKVTAIRQLQDDEIAVTFSDENGRYALAGLRGNTYKVRAVLPDDGADFTRVVTDPEGNHFQSRPGRRENFWTNFELGNGERRTVNVGAIYPASVSGTVYYDDDMSSALSGKEKTVSGFLVSVVNSEGVTVASDKTSIKGKFEIDGLVPGEYTLRATAVKDYAFTRTGEGSVMINLSEGEGYTAPFALTLGENKTGMDMGMIRPGKVTGRVFADRNDNGIQDAGEEGLSGVIVRLVENGAEAFRTEIGAGSDFTFDAVMPGRYTVVYELPERAVFAAATSGGNQILPDSDNERTGTSAEISVAAGAETAAPMCGALTLGRIQGTAFADPDGSGLQTGMKPWAEGLTVTLTPERADLEPITAVTGPEGTFQLDRLRPDTYALTVATPDGTVLSRTDALSLPLQAGMQEQTVQLTLAMGDLWEEQQLGVVKPASLKGQYWLDENNDGIRQDEEQTPAGTRLLVTDEKNGRTWAEITTDADGVFGIANLIPSSYTVSFAPDENTRAARAGDSTFTEKDGRLVMTGIALAEGEERTGMILGVVRYTSVGGTVWIDRGGNVETLPGAVMTLKAEDGSVLNSMATGETGNYRFDGLMPGTYVVEAELPGGSVVVEPGDARLQGSLTSVAAETDGRHGASDPFELLMGHDRMQTDFGAVLPGRLGDFCWLDLNGDGLQDYNEPGLAGVRIELIRDGETVMETVSDVFGFYRFDEIYPAVYTLRAWPPAEVRATRQREDLKIIASVLTESDAEEAESGLIPVESDTANYNADLGFACREAGVLPEGAGNKPTQNWTSWQGSEN